MCSVHQHYLFIFLLLFFFIIIFFSGNFFSGKLFIYFTSSEKEEGKKEEKTKEGENGRIEKASHSVLVRFSLHGTMVPIFPKISCAVRVGSL